jgi:hypothetical protein
MAFPPLDFTLDKYSELCREIINSGYKIITVSDLIQNPDTAQPVLVMRHDVDRMIGRALRMAELEKSLGITSTYYFRKAGFSRPSAIQSIAGMGHEIGFHYEVLDEARGDHMLAMELFREELARLRNIVNGVDTACMHGNPLTKWLNRDLWDHFNFHEAGIKGEAYLSVKNVYYLSDTGRIWDMSRKMKDMLPYALPVDKAQGTRIISTDDVINVVKTKEFPRFYLTIHPERWSYNIATWILDQTRDTGMNAAKQILRIVYSRRNG